LFGLREPLLRPDLRSPQPPRATGTLTAAGRRGNFSRQAIVTSRPPATGNAVVRRLGADLAAIAVRF
jgi:hypothetical protein